MATTAARPRKKTGVIAEVLGLDKAQIDGEVQRTGSSGPYWEAEVLLTWEDAERLMTTNVQGNRNLRHGYVQRYKRDMVEGRWLTESDAPICFTLEGVLDQGQHRLSAQAEAKVDILYIARVGVPLESLIAMDSGVSRSAAVKLQMLHGVPNHSHAAASGKLYLQMTSGRGRALNPSDGEIIEWVLDRSKDDLAELIRLAGKVYAHIRIPRTPLTVTFLMAKDAGISPDDLEAFADELASGIKRDGNGVSDTDATYHLRERSFKWQKHSQTQPRPPADKQIGLYVKTLNAWTTGEPMHLLKFVSTEAIPAIVTGEW